MDKLYIIKIGGNVIDEEAKLHSFLRGFAGIDGHKILVHGGGKQATRIAEQMGVAQQMTNGRRITDADTLKVVTMVYAGLINKNVVAQLQAIGCNALGLCGADGNTLLAHKRKNANLDYGYVGDVDEVNTSILSDLLSKNISPVFSPITHDKQGQLLNTNADTIARELALAFSNSWDVSLVYTFEKKGVLADTSDEQTVIPRITTAAYEKLKRENRIFAGMLPKLDNAFAAISGGVGRVIIGNAGELEKLLAGEAGTTIIHE